MVKYDIIVADPPWHYNGSIRRGENEKFTHVTDHYPTMTNKELLELADSIKEIAKDNSICFMWTTGPFLEFSIELLNKWGFKYSTVAFVWEKQRANMGAYTMSSCEFVILGKKGKIPKRSARNVRQFLSEKSIKHSKKPEEIMDRIDTIFSGGGISKIELFARNTRPGWDSWGNEIESTVDLNGSV